MILWVILFLLIMAISFILAMQSMRDYQEIPQNSKEEYALFLIRNISGFNAEALESILKHVAQEGLIISIERLFKGNFTTLTIFGPKIMLEKFSKGLDLLELEDYAANLDSNHISTWEVGIKDNVKLDPEDFNNIFNNFPKLDPEDQFFWQVILGKNQTQIRAAFYSQDPDKRKILAPLLQNMHVGKFIKLPKPFSTQQMMDFYRLRTLSKDSKVPVLTPEGIMQLLRVG